MKQQAYAPPSVDRRLGAILLTLPGLHKPARKFLIEAVSTILARAGRATFRNLSRWSILSERTYRRWFIQDIDFPAVHQEVLRREVKPQQAIAAIDATFNPKSGKKTYGVAKFWNSCAKAAGKGLELSVIAIIDRKTRRGFALNAEQTPADAGEGRTRVDVYLSQVRTSRDAIMEWTQILVGDGYYAKENFVNGVVALGFEFVGSLRSNASLKYLYAGESNKRGRPRKYDGKLDCKAVDLSRWQLAGVRGRVRLYTTTLYSPSLKRVIRVVYCLQDLASGKQRYSLLFSTNTDADAVDIYENYGLRYQIEFVFRDAKQYTGLCDSQSLKKEPLAFHYNLTLLAVNLAAVEALQTAAAKTNSGVCSIADVCRRHSNQRWIDRILLMFGHDPELEKNTAQYHSLLNWGMIHQQNCP